MVFATGVVPHQGAGTGCSLIIRDRGGVVEQLCTLVGASLPVLRLPRLFKFTIPGHGLSAPCHTHHAIQGFFPRVCFEARGRFSELSNLLISCPLDI